MRAINRKLVRDLWQMKGQAIAIALVISCGVATFVLSLSTLHSLEVTQQTYYDRYQFADIFAHLKRAPDALADRIAEIPGVAQVQKRIVVHVNLDVPGLADPAVGRLISLPETRPPVLNRLFIRRGRLLRPRRDDEILASEAFAKANQLDVGDAIQAVNRIRRNRFAPYLTCKLHPGRQTRAVLAKTPTRTSGGTQFRYLNTICPRRA